MKKILYITLLAFAAVSAAEAQQTVRPISVENQNIEVVGDDVNISFRLSAQNLDIESKGHLRLEFAIETDKQRLVLPSVIYSGGLRYRYNRRSSLLSDAYRLEPYAVYKVGSKKDKYETDYAVSIPYYPWMENAAVTYREYMHDCGGDYPTAAGVLVADLNPAPEIPEVWAPNAALYPNLVAFLTPKVEEVKARASMIELRIGFPVNVTEVRPSFGNNRYELAKADSLVSMLQSNDLIDIRAVHIKGYASPEGRYSVNERLARGRSESFKKYLANNFPENAYVRGAYTSWQPEDWEGLGRLLEADNNLAQKEDILAIVNDNSIDPDRKDLMLQKIPGWSRNYRVILADMYPKLRRIVLSVDYTIKNLTDDNRTRELLYTAPEMLSLNEIYSVARFYEPGTEQYREVYSIAARRYPDDMIANNNAAAALLQQGDAQAALPYLEKVGENEYSYINLGAYYYISGDLEKAIEYFTKAKEAGVEQAAQNLRLVTSKK